MKTNEAHSAKRYLGSSNSILHISNARERERGGGGRKEGSRAIEREGGAGGS